MKKFVKFAKNLLPGEKNGEETGIWFGTAGSVVVVTKTS